MHTFAQKPKATQQTTPAKSAIPGRGHFGQSPEVRSISHLQRTIGNQAVQRMLQADAQAPEAGLTGSESPRFGHDFSRTPIHPPAAAGIQTTLAINKPGDSYEQEADRMAEQVMRTPESPESQLHRARPCGGGSPRCQGQQPGPNHDGFQTKRVQANVTGQIAAPPIVHEVLRSPGQPLDPATRAFMEPRFGHDFSRVRVHTDAHAAESARAVSALAYTVGNNVVFGANQYMPATHHGRELLAHELAHTVQQAATSGAPSGRENGALQRAAGNLAISGLIQRAPVGGAKASGPRARQAAPRAAFGPSAEIVNFAILFELATTRDALTTGRFDNRSFAFTSPRLARTAELLPSVVGVIASERRGGEINQAVAFWRSIEADIRAILVQAGQRGAPLDEAWAGFARLQEALHGEQAEELVRSGEASASLAAPDVGLYAEQDRDLGRIFQALAKVIDESKGILQWNGRHIYRMTGLGGAGASEAQVRLMNYGRTVLSAAALWTDFRTLDERVAEARRKGWINVSGVYVEFFSRMTTTAVDTTNAVVGLLKASTEKALSSVRDTMVKISTHGAASKAGQAGNLMFAEYKLAKRVSQFEGFRWAGGISGGVQIVSSVWNLVIAIRADDLRGGVAAGHSIVQGGITLGTAITGASAAASTFLSGSVTVVWVTIEALFDIAELSAWGRRQQKLKEIAAVLQGAARLIPAGMRMAGVADAFSRIDTEDSSERLAMEQRLTALGAAPFAVVLRGLLGIKTEVGGRPEWARVMGAEAGQALAALSAYENWPPDAVSPDVIGNVSAIAKPIFVGLRRVSDWAIAKYGEANQTDAGQARVRALEAGDAVPHPQ